ncbi:MAG TPA: alpha/beta hydrolase [Verrucomicrobiae bacterium]|nr:alpha/beta hydrolase [Verrucomicrobiae bacterium]
MAANISLNQPINPSSARAKGPPVWLDMDQKALDDAYDQSVYAPNQQLVARRRARASEAVLERLGEPWRVAYGPTEIEKLDIYKTSRPNAPVNVYIHGGAWRNGQAKDFAFPAEVFVNAGAHFVIVDFVQVTETGGDLMPMIGQVRSALAWVYLNAARFGGDAERVYITGHSSGAHLAGCALVTDWQKDFGLPADMIKGGLLISGMYDLKPVRLSKRSEYVRFTDDIEQALSSQRHLDKLNAPLIVAYGTQETPEFQRQSREFAAAVNAAGRPVELIVGEGLNHFEMQETLGNPYGIAGRAALKLMTLSMQPS